jgi:hypothetical protein
VGLKKIPVDCQSFQISAMRCWWVAPSSSSAGEGLWVSVSPLCSIIYPLLGGDFGSNTPFVAALSNSDVTVIGH